MFNMKRLVGIAGFRRVTDDFRTPVKNMGKNTRSSPV